MWTCKVICSVVWILKWYVLLLLPMVTSLTTVQMFALEYIGMAAAIGYVIDLPRIIRVFACNVYENGHNLEPLVFDRSFLEMLDAGPSLDEDFREPKSYELAWWTSGEAAKAAREQDVLCFSTLDLCLKYHRDQIDADGSKPAPLLKTKYTWSRDLFFKPEGVKLDCVRCHLYRSAAVGVVDDLLDMRHHAQGLEASAMSRSHLTQRRAAGFHQLHEAAIVKEQQMDPNYMNRARMDSDLTPAPAAGEATSPHASTSVRKGKGKGKGKARATSLERQVREQASVELERLQPSPGAYWTWGTALSRKDVLALAPAEGPKGTAHSGYVESLPLGTSETSSVASGSVPAGSSAYSELGADVLEIPELDLSEYPHHFEFHPLRYSKSLEECDPVGPTRRLPLTVLAPPAADYMSYPPTLQPQADHSGE